jgi:hypothetical protein
VGPAAAGRAAIDPEHLTAELQQSAYGGVLWGANTPQWRLFMHGAFAADLAANGVPDHVYVLVWVSDDIEDNDGNPAIDNNGIVVVRARALGLRGSQCDAQAVVARTDSAGVLRRTSWRRVR